MQIRDFQLERYFALHEFTARYLLSASDCEALSLADLLDLADDEMAALWRGLKLSYTESQGNTLLRAEIAALYEGVTADDVLIAAPEELIFIAMHALLAPGDQVITLAPAYQSLHEVARALGCTVTPWSLTHDGAGWRLDLAALERLLTPRARLLVINFPHNPTGFLPTRAELQAILRFAIRHSLFVFSDEMYRLLEYDASDRLPSVASLYERSLALSGLSKSFALPGLRIGWLVGRDRTLLRRCIAFHDYTTICNSAPAESLGIVALRAAEHILARNLEIIRGNLAVAQRFFIAHRDLFTWLPPAAGSVAFPQLRPDRPVADFGRELLAQKSVMIVPGAMFGHAGNHFRIGLGRVNFPAALGQVEDHLANPVGGGLAPEDGNTSGWRVDYTAVSSVTVGAGRGAVLLNNWP